MIKRNNPLDDLKPEVIIEWIDSVMDAGNLDDDSTVADLKEAIAEPAEEGAE